MKKNFPKALLLCSALIGMSAVALLNGCGSDKTNIVEASPSGTLTQGPISGATVWADRITADFPNGNGIQDADEVFTTTGPNGDFRYATKPGYSYISRSKGGIDTITNQAALPLAAPAGSTTITPITTLVASLPSNSDGSLSVAQQALVTKIETIMGGEEFDSDPGKKTTPAALALTKSIEIAMTVASRAVSASAANNGSIAPTAAQITLIETTVSNAVVKAIAEQIALPATTTATLSSAATLATAISIATQTAATTLTTNSATTNIVFYDTSAIAASVQTAVTSVATDIAVQSGNSATSMGTSANTTEAAIILPLVTKIDKAQNLATDSTIDSVTSSAPPVVADTAPAVSSFTPATGATAVPIKSSITVSFTKAMDLSTLTAAGAMTITGPAGAVPFSTSYSSLSNTVILTPNADLAANAIYTVNVAATVKDLSAKLTLGSAKTWSFTTAASVDIAPPTAVVVPASGATNVTNDANVSATFNKSVTPTTVTTTTFSVTKGGVKVPGTVRYDKASNVATFIPALPLSFGTTYTVTLNGVTSVSGTAISAVSTTFSTLANPDSVKPTAILSTNIPAASNGRIATGSAFVVTFSKAIDPTTINSTTFFVKFKAGTGSEVIAGTISYNAVTHVASFTPSAELPANRIVIATVTTAVTDLSGNVLSAQASQEFTTAQLLTGSTGGNAF